MRYGSISRTVFNAEAQHALPRTRSEQRIESLATALALGVGAYWTYTRFIKQRENYAFIEFTVDMYFVGKQDGQVIVELIAYLENKGKVQHRFSDLTFDLALMSQEDPVRSSPKYNGQAFFPHERPRRAWVPSDTYFIEPGIKAKYSYKNQPAWHTAERTPAVPAQLPASSGSGLHDA